MSKYYKPRIDVTDKFSEVRTFMKENSPDVWAYCLEDLDGNNPHSHWYIEPKKTATWFRSKLREFGLTGNGAYSFKNTRERFPIEYLAYMMKQSKFKYKGIPDDVIKSAQEYNEKVKNEIKEKKDKKKNLITQIEEFVSKKLPENVTINNLKIDDWVETCLLFYQANGLLVREFQIISLSDTLFLKHGGGIALYSLKRRIMSKIEK